LRQYHSPAPHLGRQAAFPLLRTTFAADYFSYTVAGSVQCPRQHTAQVSRSHNCDLWLGVHSGAE
jgi:hypothetical protein